MPRRRRHELTLPPRTRVTPARRAVMDAIGAADGAFTVLDVFDRARADHPALGLATAYRTIDLLQRAGSVHPLPGAGRAAYIRCRPGHHHHLVCVECGAVEETDLCAAPDDATVLERHGFEPQTHELDIYGRCKRCR
ncbi:MAG TPA: Fur family transcriptional regulator [Gaiellaceae bacterium]|nr:Fur family transcriptional regulator [Gaiellaceae bacterium]